MEQNIETKELTKGFSRFAAELYQKCAEKSFDKNVIISPHSVACALALLSQGAQNNTFAQIAHGLHLASDKARMAAEYEKHYNLLMEAVGQSTLCIANQLYVQKGFPLKQTFCDTAVKQFNSDVDSLDFSKSEAAAETINSFVANKTNSKIKNMFDPDSFDEDTRLVLVNAIYFKGRWSRPFRSQNTAPGDFYIDETKTIKVNFMNAYGPNYLFAELNDLNATALQLNYGQSNISFVVILSNDLTGLSALEASLKTYDLSEITKCFNRRNVRIALPKFKIEFQIGLNNVLQELGMIEMFNNKADFKDFLESSERLNVSKVIHKAFIEVNEEGAEAAAATGIRCIKKKRVNWSIFIADHPFLYYIMDTNTNTVLFCGRCINFN